MNNSTSHLGVLFNNVRDGGSSVENRTRKLFAATNAVLGRLGPACKEDRTRRTVVDRQVFPVLACGSHLWCLDKKATCQTVDIT